MYATSAFYIECAQLCERWWFGPSKSVCGSRLQNTFSCCSQKPGDLGDRKLSNNMVFHWNPFPLPTSLLAEAHNWQMRGDKSNFLATFTKDIPIQAQPNSEPNHWSSPGSVVCLFRLCIYFPTGIKDTLCQVILLFTVIPESRKYIKIFCIMLIETSLFTKLLPEYLSDEEYGSLQ